MQSCSPALHAYRQIGTLTSDNVEVNNDEFQYKHSAFTISYDFWSEGGNVLFTITNNSDEDIYLLKDQCFFVINGWAQDYYKNRTYVTSASSSSSTATTIGFGSSENAQLSGNLKGYGKMMFNTLGGNADYNKLSKGVGFSRMFAETSSQSSQSGYSVETKEPQTICIPAHSSKQFSEFNVMGSPYRTCGFARDPQGKDGVSWNFLSALDSPRTIENRLIFKVNGEIVPIVNTFYVSQLTNISEKNSMSEVSATDCKGNKTNTKVERLYAPNKFYTGYKCAIGVDNDINDKKTQKK